MNDYNLSKLEEIYSGPKSKLTSGVDFDYWKPLDKARARADLGINPERFVIFSSSRLIPIKQIDKLIRILEKLSKRYDFLLIVSGGGDKAYEGYLKNKAGKLEKQGKVWFTGYLFSEKLRDFYAASDLFVNTSISEGGPVSTMKAFACEIPVFSTNVGHTAEVMQANNAGVVVEKNRYGQWKRELEDIFRGKKVKILDRETARSHYEWQSIARNFIGVYQEVQKKYYPELVTAN
jgi:glycosyltransferase involved in cell wall biosynthesis